MYQRVNRENRTIKIFVSPSSNIKIGNSYRGYMKKNRIKSDRSSIPSLVFSDEKGNIMNHPELYWSGNDAGSLTKIDNPSDWIEIPPGSELFTLKKRIPIGYNRRTMAFEELKTNPYTISGPVHAVAAWISPAYSILHTSAYSALPDAPTLPLFAYAPVGWYNGKFVVSALRIDSDKRQDFQFFDMAQVKKRIAEFLNNKPNNRLVRHLSKCATEYGCACAKNFFMSRWEAPLPVSSKCNARCVGCISLQEDQMDFPSSQERIPFLPTLEEIVEIAVPHLESAEAAVVSFGQGCEGEPLLQSLLISNAILAIRSKTEKGTIHINTNGTMPKKVKLLRESGLDSMRVSLNSVRPNYYQAYYRPKGAGLSSLKESVKVMKELGGYVSINYLFLPGLNDEEEEVEELVKFIRETELDFIQLKNLNIDPEYYLQKIGYQPKGQKLGIRNLIKRIKEEFPRLQFGYFNPPIQGITSGSIA